ncbi:MAG: carbohydrate-binding family 9-like protein [Sedimentisphaerales bacterium]|nr:carbohydrate-binding family 9-like protein [Sedimentisphaerales bacterium]
MTITKCILTGWIVIAFLLAQFGCQPSHRSNAAKTYRVARAARPVPIDGHWDKSAWRSVPALTLDHYMGDRPDFLPPTEVKLQYDEQNIYVIFRVQDRYVRAVTTEPHGPVWLDSCVEFFFTPGPDISPGYFNLETNCIGAALFHHQVQPRLNPTPLAASDLDRLELVSSLAGPIDPEITEATTWTLEYRLPIDMLKSTAAVQPPRPGVLWRANFQKCADDSSHPHWLTWSKIDVPRPDFHRPEYFGFLLFE